MRHILSTLTLSLLVTSPALAGSPDVAIERDGAPAEAGQPLTIIDAGKGTPCAVKAGMCLTPGPRTVAVASAALVAATTPGKSAAAPVVPRFSRAAALASGSAGATQDESAPWSLELMANLKRPAWNGNALFIFFDLEDADAIENHQYTALYQTPIKSGPKLAAHVALSPAEGFRAGHTYRVRIVQLVGGKEIVLAEGDVSLL